jgi:hypothetical protein
MCEGCPYKKEMEKRRQNNRRRNEIQDIRYGIRDMRKEK